MAFLSSFDICASGLTATRLRTDIISENIAHQGTTRTNAEGAAVPYRRKMVVYQPVGDNNNFRAIFDRGLKSFEQPRGVQVSKIIEDESPFKPVYNPEHPDSDEQGYVLMPNVDPVKETMDMMAATRAYDANITVFNSMKAMATAAIQMGR